MHKSQKRTICTWLKLFGAVLLFSFGNYALNTLWHPALAWIDSLLGSGSEEVAWPPQLVLVIVIAMVCYGWLITVIISWFSDFTGTSGVRAGSEGTTTTEAQSIEKTEGDLSAGQETQPVPIERTDSLPSLVVLGAGALLWLFGLLLLGANSEVRFAFTAISWGLSAILGGYAIWSLLYGKDGWKRPSEFAKHVCKAFCAVLAVLGVALVLQGIGSLAALEGLRFIGRTLAEVFGGS